MKIQLLIDGALRTVMLEAGEGTGQFTGEMDGVPVLFEAALIAPQVVSLVLRSGPLAGRSCRCVFSRDALGQNGKVVQIAGQDVAYQVHDPRSLSARSKRSDSVEGTMLIKASMAGRVVRVLVEAGAEVEAQAGIVVIEAMKMQNELRATRAGRVVEVKVSAGEMVNAGQVLAVVE
jgi:biotin carboxyl carrier protein